MQRLAQSAGAALVTAGTAWVGFNQLIYNVDAGCRGVIFDRFRGVLPDVTGEGKHIMRPGVNCFKIIFRSS